MNLDLSKPILYLITRGATIESTTARCAEFKEILSQVSAAVTAGIDLIQIREKNLTTRVLFELAQRAAELTSGTATRVLINDRVDVAAGAGVAGVHLTAKSIDTAIVRRTTGEDLLIGVSTHSLDEALRARDGGADFVVFGPVFETLSKLEYGPPLGLRALADAASALAPFPLLALGGISIANAPQCLRAGARGLAGISLFADSENLRTAAESIRSIPTNLE